MDHEPMVQPTLVGTVQTYDRRPAGSYLASLGAGSRRTMAATLHAIAHLLSEGHADARSLDWARVRREHGLALRAAMLERGYSPSSVNKALAAFRGVLREAWRAGLLAAEDYQAAIDVPTVRAERLPRGRALSVGELTALMAACRRDAGPIGARDAALIALLYAGGIRRSEAVALDREDYDAPTGEVKVRSGKGRKQRTLYLANGSLEAMADWLRLRGDTVGPLFYAVRKGGRLEPRRISDQAVLYIARHRADQAGVRAFSPHDLRRSMISEMLDRGVDLATVQRIAGHSSPTTTARYDRRGEEAKRRAASVLHVPYTPR